MTESHTEDSRSGDREQTAVVGSEFTDRLARRVLEHSPVSIVVVAADGRICWSNEEAASTLGVPLADLTNVTYDDIAVQVTDADGSPVPVEELPVTRVLERGEPCFGFEHWIERPDGSERWLTTNASPLFGADGNVEYGAVTFEDVTALKRREERLTSDHLRHVEFRADESAIPPSLQVEESPIRLEIESIVSVPGNATVQYMQTADLSPTEFVTAIEEVPHLADVRLLATMSGTSRIEVRAETETVSEVFQTLGGRPRAIVVTSDAVSFHGELPGDVDPRLAADGIRRFHDDVELVAADLVYSPQVLADAVADALTERQLAVLEAAYFSGYFESPRASTGTELADRFGVTRQTFNQHLRRAQQIVCRHLFERSGAAAR